MKTLVGIVRSNKMTKTAVVETTRFWEHPIYHKRVKRTKRYLAHDELGVAVGDHVTMGEGRPLSKLKRWKIIEVIKNKK